MVWYTLFSTLFTYSLFALAPHDIRILSQFLHSVLSITASFPGCLPYIVFLLPGFWTLHSLRFFIPHISFSLYHSSSIIIWTTETIMFFHYFHEWFQFFIHSSISDYYFLSYQLLFINISFHILIYTFQYRIRLSILYIR